MIEIFRGADRQFRWHRRTTGRVVAQGESHRRKWNAKRAARRQFPNDEIVDLTKS